MVVETAGGKKDVEKQDIDSVPLPGYAEIPLQAPAKQCWKEQETGVKCRRSRNKGCCGCLTLLLILGLIAVSVYFGVMSHRYKNKLARKCGWGKPEPWRPMDDDMDDEIDYIPIDPPTFNNMDEEWNSFAAIVGNCVRDNNELEIVDDSLGDEVVEDDNMLSVDPQCLRGASQQIKRAVRRLFRRRPGRV